jgi:hypothetical protein
MIAYADWSFFLIETVFWLSDIFLFLVLLLDFTEAGNMDLI